MKHLVILSIVASVLTIDVFLHHATASKRETINRPIVNAPVVTLESFNEDKLVCKYPQGFNK